MAITQLKGSKRSPVSSPSKSKLKQKIAWQIKKRLAEKRFMSLGDKKMNLIEKAESLQMDKAMVCYPNTENITNDTQAGVGVSMSAMERAREVQAKLSTEFPSFVKQMLKSHVSGGFWLGLPSKFCQAHLPKHDETVVLVDEHERESNTKYLAEKSGLSGGWRGFSMEHKLLEGDALVFQLIEPCKFKLYIVRARTLTEVDGAMSLLKLDTQPEPIAVKMEGQPEENTQGQNYLELVDVKRHQEKSNGRLTSNNGAPVDQPSQKHLEPIAVENHSKRNTKRLISRNGPAADQPSQKYPEPVAAKNHQERNSEMTTTNGSAADQSGDDGDNASSEFVDGIRFSESQISFKDVKGFHDFNIHVDGLILDSEIPAHLRKKYYELCRSQSMYLHDNLIPCLNTKLAAGMISETINIADAIRAAKPSTGLNNLESWDKTLKAFEDLGMMVGFLRARIHKLLSAFRESQAVTELKRKLRAEAEENMRALKAVIERLDNEIDDLKAKNEKLGLVFKDITGAPW